jgi:hypothetical protein
MDRKLQPHRLIKATAAAVLDLSIMEAAAVRAVRV